MPVSSQISVDNEEGSRHAGVGGQKADQQEKAQQELGDQLEGGEK